MTDRRKHKNLETARSNRLWTQDEENILIELSSQGKTPKFMAEALGRSRNAIQNRMSIMTLRGDLFSHPIAKPAKRKRSPTALKPLDPIMRAKFDEIITQPDSMWPAPLPLEQHDNSISVKLPRNAVYGFVSAALIAAAFYAGMNV